LQFKVGKLFKPSFIIDFTFKGLFNLKNKETANALPIKKPNSLNKFGSAYM